MGTINATENRNNITVFGSTQIHPKRGSGRISSDYPDATLRMMAREEAPVAAPQLSADPAPAK